MEANESQGPVEQAAVACIGAIAASEGGAKKPAAAVGKRRCLLDSEERDFTITKKMSLAIILILIAAFPYYIIRTRKSWETLWTLGLSVLFAVFYGGLYAVGEYIGIFFYNVEDGYWGLG